MSSYFKRLISLRIVDKVKSHIKYKLPNEEKLVKAFNQGIRLRVPVITVLTMDRYHFKLRVTNPEILKAILSEDLQPKNLSDRLITRFSLSKSTREGDAAEILINVNEFELRKHVLSQIWKEREHYGYKSFRDKGNKQTVFIECPSAAVLSLGPFHCMDLYSAIIANASANIYKAAGHDVINCHYVCDCSFTFACLYKGLEEKGNIEQYIRNPVSHIYEIYQEMKQATETNEVKKINVKRVLKKIRNEDKSVMVNVKKIRDVISTENKKIFEKLGIQFTHTEWESVYVRQQEFGTFKTKRGDNLIIEGIVALEDRYKKYQYDIMIYAGIRKFMKLGSHMQNKKCWKSDSPLFDLIQEGKVRIALISLKIAIVAEQKKSTEECLNSTKQQVMDALKSKGDPEKIENIEEVAEMIGNTCIIVQTLLSLIIDESKRIGVFENIENGMFLQDVHARLCQRLRFNAEPNINELLEVSDDIIKCLEEPEAFRLILFLCQYEELFENTVIKNQPTFIVSYLLQIGSCINDCLDTLPVKNQPHDIAFARLLLFACAKIVFSNGLRLLGIKPLDKIWD